MTRSLLLLACLLSLGVGTATAEPQVHPTPEEKKTAVAPMTAPIEVAEEETKKAMAKAAVVAIMKNEPEALAGIAFTYGELTASCPKFLDDDALAGAMIADMSPEQLERAGGKEKALAEARGKVGDMRKTVEKRFDKEARLKSAEEALEQCAKFNFADASPVEVTGGEPKKDALLDSLCPDNDRFDDIEIVFEHEGKRARIQLDTPATIGGRHGVLDEVECRFEDAGASK